MQNQNGSFIPPLVRGAKLPVSFRAQFNDSSNKNPYKWPKINGVTIRFLFTPTKVELYIVSWNIYDGSDGLDLTLEFGWVIFFYGFWKPRYSGVIAYPIRSMFCRSFRPKRLILWPWCCRDRRRRPGIWWNHFCGFLRARPATKKKILIYRILPDWCISIHGWLILFGKLKGKNRIYIYIYIIFHRFWHSFDFADP